MYFKDRNNIIWFFKKTKNDSSWDSKLNNILLKKAEPPRWICLLAMLDISRILGVFLLLENNLLVLGSPELFIIYYGILLSFG